MGDETRNHAININRVKTGNAKVWDTRQVYWATGIGSPGLETASQEIRRGKVDATATLSQLKFEGETSCQR